MVMGISKRQQSRNEKALQDLIRTVPGNDRCADCEAFNPGWASWNIGIFLCMRCAALHRKLGTHISKVKSLTMDSWSAEQVDNMKSHGNTIMNKIYNPKNVKTPIPVDVDEADSAMERFIRQKYQHRSLEDGKPKPPSRHDTGYTTSLEDRSPEGSPPPLPPKSGKFFGFNLRTAASTSNLHRQSKAQATSPRSERHHSPPPLHIGSRDFGGAVDDMSTASLAAKLTTLRDMGFPDDRRNATVLKGLSGDLEKAIESLIRLGEGSNPASRSRTPIPPKTTATTTAVASQAPTQQDSSYNPFDQLDSKPPPQPAGKSYNPFDMPAPQPPGSALEASFQNLQVSQPLFPHSTGGYPSQQHSIQPLYQQSATPPVTGTFSQNQFVSSPQAFEGGNNPFFQSSAQPQTGFTNQSLGQNLGVAQTNPFFNQASQQPQGQSSVAGSIPTIGAPNPPRHSNTMPALSSTSPFGPQPSFQQQPQQQPAQPQLQPYQPSQPAQQPQSAFPSQNSYNPFQTMPAPANPQSAGYQPQYQSQLQPGAFQAPPQHLSPQPTGRMDKSSILSLYGLSPAPPMPSQQQQQQQPQQAMASPVPGLTPSLGSTPQTQPASTPQQPQHAPPPGLADSVGFLGSRNPFMSATPASQGMTQPGFPGAMQQQQQPQSGLGIGMGMGMGMKAPAPAAGAVGAHQGFAVTSPGMVNFPRNHSSQQSVDINGLQNGRHSPDAFAGLSARYG